MTRFPKDARYAARFFVADLSPEQAPELKGLHPRLVFVAESPHEAETAPEDAAVRRPLCGRAGQAFWRMIGELLGEGQSSDTSRERLLKLSKLGRFAVMNAVQFPLDPKIMAYYGKAADPVEQLGFSKVPPASYKQLRQSRPVQEAIELLRARLFHPSVRALPVVSLGNDAQWFVNRAVSEVGQGRHLMTIPHPSAWWRQGGKLRERAREGLTSLLVNGEGLGRSQSEAPVRSRRAREDRA